MTIIRATVRLPTAVFEAQQLRIKGSVQRFQSFIQINVLPRSQARTDTTINQPLAAHKRPTDWQTPKQRRWWFKVGVHLWQGRKAKQDWLVQHEVEGSGGQIVAVNPMPGAKYVFMPPTQQRMHMGVWMTTTDYAQAENAALVDDVRTAWMEAANEEQP